MLNICLKIHFLLSSRAHKNSSNPWRRPHPDDRVSEASNVFQITMTSNRGWPPAKKSALLIFVLCGVDTYAVRGGRKRRNISVFKKGTRHFHDL